ncbi:MAG: hypothetical protein ABUT39_07195 [Acidobacteriota bacterium]
MATTRFLSFQTSTPDSLVYQSLAGTAEVVVADGSQNPKDFQMVMVDCTSTAASAMGGIVPQLKAALDANVPVLLLDPQEEHKKSLSPKVHGWSSGASAACFLCPLQNGDSGQIYSVTEQFAPRTAAEGTLMMVEAQADSNGQVTVSAPVEVATSTNVAPDLQAADVEAFAADVSQTLADLSQNGGIILATGNPPPGCPYWAAPYKIYQPLGVGGGSGSSPTATQTVSGTASMGIYYDNLTYTNPVQWTIIGNQGNYSSDIVQNDDSGLGWTIGGFKILGPGLATQGDFSLYQSSPQSVSGQTTYTSSTSFTVGVSAGTDGLGSNASYTQTNGVSYSINDWEITLTNDDSWNFYQQTPYNGESQGFPDGAESGGNPAGLPSISTSALSFAAQTVWLALQPLQSTMPITFTYQVYPTCIIFSNINVNWHANFYYYSNYQFSQTYNLDFGPANPGA